MADEEIDFGGVYFTPRGGVGWLTDGKLGSFTGPFPQGATSFAGGEMSFQLDRYSGGRTYPLGSIALMYYWGHSSDNFSHEDLPLGSDPLLSLIKFTSERESNSHFALVEWRWATDQPVFRSAHWSLIHPKIGVGLGAFYISTMVNEGTTPPYEKARGNFVGTAAPSVDLVGFHWGEFQMNLSAGARIFAGQAFGVMTEGGLTFGWSPNALQF